MKNKGNVTAQKEHSKLLVTELKEMEIHELPVKEFKIIILNMLRVLQENPDKQLNTEKTIQEQNDKFNKR